MSLEEPIFQPQGLLSTEILVDREAFDSQEPYDIILSVIDYVNWTFRTCKLVRGEFPLQAIQSYHADLYLSQVNNGGHRQFAKNTQLPDATMADIELALNAMGADDFLANFRNFAALVKNDPDLLRRMAERDFHKNKTPALQTLEALDDRHFELNKSEKFIALNEAWLRSLPNVKPVSDSDLSAEAAAIIARNPLFDARTIRNSQLVEEQEAADPLYVAAKALCAKAGLQFEGFTAGSLPDDKGSVFWGVRTSKGMRFALINVSGSILYLDHERTKPVATIKPGDDDRPAPQSSIFGFLKRLFSR